MTLNQAEQNWNVPTRPRAQVIRRFREPSGGSRATLPFRFFFTDSWHGTDRSAAPYNSVHTEHLMPALRSGISLATGRHYQVVHALFRRRIPYAPSTPTATA